MTRTAKLGLVACALASACAGRNVSMELQFPDPVSRSETTGLQITAIEPFVAGDEVTGRERLLLKCGEMGVFGPTAKVNRDQSELPMIQTLLNRELRKFPLEGDWTVDLQRFQSSEESNPWRAIMVHIEARGLAHKSEGGLAPAPEDKTILEGCYCVRMNESATLSTDLVLDREVKENCAVAVEGAPTIVSLRPVVSDQFRLEPCGVRAATAPRGRQAEALPGVCINATPCNQDPSGNCFPCRSGQCEELKDLRNVPVRVTVEQENGTAAPDPGIILSNQFGTVVPRVQVDDCASPITIRAEVIGRLDSAIEFPVNCVDPIDFAATPTDKVEVGLSLNGVNVAAVGMIPEVRAGTRVETPARVAVLVNASSNRSVLELYEADGRSLVLADDVALMDGAAERGLGLLGFHYDVVQKRIPLLAVVSADGNKPIVRVFRFDEAERELKEISRTIDETCAFDACATVNECNADPMSRPCQMPLTLATVMPPIPMAVSDRNDDGFADFSFATDRGFQMYTYFSSPMSPDGPPPLDGACQCSAFGRGMPSYELLSLGGPQSGAGPNTDLIMGDGTGAYVRYAAEDRVDGMPCATSTVGDVTHGAKVALPCPSPLICAQLCPGDESSARCVEQCTVGGMGCNTSAARPTCVPKTPGDSAGYCGGPGLSCRSLNSVWRLTTIHDVAKGQLSGDTIEDAVAVGAGSPVPSSGSSGAVRIMYGGPLDLTKIEEQKADIRNASFVELTARRLKGAEDAQSPRGAEIADFNGDGIADIAAIYTSSEEIRVWLGGGNLVPGEIGRTPGSDEGGRIRLNECGDTCPSRQRCFPFSRFAVGDLDADGKSEVVAVCVPDTDGPHPTLKWFKPVTP